MEKNTRDQKHAEIALAIKGAKKKMLANSRAGMDLREAADKFIFDIAVRFDGLLPRHIEMPETQAEQSEVSHA